MLNKSLQKLIRSLDTKKGRRKEGLFVAEGPKVVEELMQAFEVVHLAATEDWLKGKGWNGDSRVAGISGISVISRISGKPIISLVSEEELSRLSLLQAPQQVLAVMRVPSPSFLIPHPSSLILALDGVQDPGNVGTIIRVADWFGVQEIWCSADTCDVWNPKVVQATMGSLARVKVYTVDLPEILKTLPADMPIYATALDGKNIYQTSLYAKGVIVMGNEGNGISEAVRACCTQQLLIPRFSVTGPESLNVAMATGIILSEFCRRQYEGGSLL